MNTVTIRYVYRWLDPTKHSNASPLPDNSRVTGTLYPAVTLPPALSSTTAPPPPDELDLGLVLWTSSDATHPASHGEEATIEEFHVPGNDVLFTGWYEPRGGGPPPPPGTPIFCVVQAVDADTGELLHDTNPANVAGQPVLPPSFISSVTPASAVQADKTIRTPSPVTVNFLPTLDVWRRVGRDMYFKVRLHFVGCTIDPAKTDPSGFIFPVDTAGRVVAIYGNGEVIVPPIPSTHVGSPHRLEPGEPVMRWLAELNRLGTTVSSKVAEKARTGMIAQLEAELRELRRSHSHG